MRSGGQERDEEGGGQGRGEEGKTQGRTRRAGLAWVSRVWSTPEMRCAATAAFRQPRLISSFEPSDVAGTPFSSLARFFSSFARVTSSSSSRAIR